MPYKSREILSECSYLLEKLIKKYPKRLDSEGQLKTAFFIVEICGQNRLEFVEKWKIIKT